MTRFRNWPQSGYCIKLYASSCGQNEGKRTGPSLSRQQALQTPHQELGRETSAGENLIEWEPIPPLPHKHLFGFFLIVIQALSTNISGFHFLFSYSFRNRRSWRNWKSFQKGQDRDVLHTEALPSICTEQTYRAGSCPLPTPLPHTSTSRNG